MKFKDLLSGFVRLHVLHHAAEHEIYVSGSSKSSRGTAMSSAPEHCIPF
nr:hypothetical protein [Bradyrhizobium sp. UFLA03-84]